jgi:hypothetical protein
MAATGDGAGDGAEAEAQQGPTTDELQKIWAREQRLLEYLMQQGYDADHPLRVAAERQAADAKAAWQRSKPGAAVTSRLVWAEQALHRARKAQARLEQSISELDDDYQRIREERMDLLRDLRNRTREREAKLAEISEQAAEEFRSPAADDADNVPLRHVIGTIDGPIRDAMADALAQAVEGSPLHTRLSGAMGALSSLPGLVAQAARPRWADVFDMASHGDGGWDGEDGGFDGGDWGGDQGWGYQQQNQWEGQHDGDAWAHASRPWDDDEPAAPMDLGDVQVPAWIPNGSGAETRQGTTWGSRAWKRGRMLAHDRDGMQGRHADAEEVTEDHEAAARLQAQQGDAAAAAAAAAAASAAAAPPTPTPADIALEERKRAVWDAAQLESVQVSGEEIANMDAVQLEAWASENLSQL